MIMEDAVEINFDGIVGPTHNYSGLAVGNLASQRHVNQASNPRLAALQGLEKMKFLAGLGARQAVLPPQDRPDFQALRRAGLSGGDERVFRDAASAEPRLLASCSSASSMWAANAATVSPSVDAADGRVHFTAANLHSLFHRSLESRPTAAMLRAIFAEDSVFAHHRPLPPRLPDEGAANHIRLAPSHGSRGLEIFVYGRAGPGQPGPHQFEARQSRDASENIAQVHGLNTSDTLLIQQNPDAIDAGVFHNDVVAVGNQNVLLFHQSAFVDTPGVIDSIRRWFDAHHAGPFHPIEVKEDQVPLPDAVSTYLLNSQLIGDASSGMSLIAPTEAQTHPRTRQFIDELLAANGPIRHVHFVDVRQSMNNGGGPACLRLRVTLNPRELSLVHPGVLFSEALYQSLKSWIERHYRDQLTPDDLADPDLLHENRRALDELTRILNLGSFYPFQRD